MDQKQFVTELQDRLKLNKKEINALISDTVDLIKERVVMMDTISIQGFGAFETRKKMERISVNPTTGNRMLIPPKITVTFKPGTIIKNKLKDLPKYE